MVVILSDLEEFSYAEIAQALEVPVGTVRSRLARARSALQKILWQQAKDIGLSASAPAQHDCEDAGAQAARPESTRASSREKKGSVT